MVAIHVGNQIQNRMAAYNRPLICFPTPPISPATRASHGLLGALSALFNSTYNDSTTVGQIVMHSMTYNYSSKAIEGLTYPPVSPPINCTLVFDDWP